MTKPNRIEVNWYDEDHLIIHSYMLYKWTWEDFIASYQEVLNKAASVPHSIYWLITSEKLRYIPSGSPFPFTNYMIRNKAPNGAGIVIVTNSSFVKMMLNIIARTTPLGSLVFTAETLDAALQLIESKLGQPIRYLNDPRADR